LEAPTRQALETIVVREPANFLAWLQLGDARQRSGESLAALLAWFQAITRAQLQGRWLDQASTPSELQGSVANAVAQVRQRRRELYFGCYDELRQRHGATALARVDRALSAHLREWDGRPADPRQKPRFFFFPDLPSQPYLDPTAQPWAPTLLSAFEGIRNDALSVLAETAGFEDFVRLRQGDRMANYLGGQRPSWEAFFFFRHGTRYDENHARCPATSRALESVDLCRIADHAPEICFSLLAPGTHILPHYGVTNVRTVMHLPLVVPRDCALNIVGVGPHVWREGELMMFDDTFQHEAWNRSTEPRLILLMDCWNPALSAVEREAMARLIPTIATLHKAARVARGA
jgi:aspartate beta-hydroxylase